MTREEIEAIAEEVGCGSYPSSNGIFQPPLNLQKYTLRIQAKERERCAKVCDGFAKLPDPYTIHGDNCAKAIRTLGIA